MGPDKQCGITSQRIGTCAISLNAIFTPIFIILYACVGIALIVLLACSIRNHFRDKKKTARMVKTHHLNSKSGTITNSHLWEELNAEANDKKELYSGYQIRSPATTVTELPTLTSMRISTKPRNVRWISEITEDMQQRRAAAKEKRGGKRKAKDEEDEEDEEDEKPVGKAGITTSNFRKAKSEASSMSYGSTPTPGASSECSLGTLAKTKSLVGSRRELRARSPAVARKSQFMQWK